MLAALYITKTDVLLKDKDVMVNTKKNTEVFFFLVINIEYHDPKSMLARNQLSKGTLGNIGF